MMKKRKKMQKPINQIKSKIKCHYKEKYDKVEMCEFIHSISCYHHDHNFFLSIYQLKGDFNTLLYFS